MNFAFDEMFFLRNVSIIVQHFWRENFTFAKAAFPSRHNLKKNVFNGKTV